MVEFNDVWIDKVVLHMIDLSGIWIDIHLNQQRNRCNTLVDFIMMTKYCTF